MSDSTTTEAKVQCQKDWIFVAAQQASNVYPQSVAPPYFFVLDLAQLVGEIGQRPGWLIVTETGPQLSIELDQILLHKKANSGSSDIRKTCTSDLPGES